LCLPLITNELASVLAFHGQHAFALGTVIALAESRLDLGWRWPARLVATAAEDRLNAIYNRWHASPLSCWWLRAGIGSLA